MSFVILSKDEFEQKCLPDGWEIFKNDIANEIIYSFPTSVKNLAVHVYSTVDKRTLLTREIGTDAIRIVFYDTKNDRPIGKGKRIHRTEGATTIASRIQSRIKDFLSTAGEQSIIDFGYVRAILSHEAVEWMEFAQSLLEQLEERGSLSDTQLKYVLGKTNPKGKQTFEAKVKEKDPDFVYVEYEDDNSETSNEIEKPIPTEIISFSSHDPIPCEADYDNPAAIEEEHVGEAVVSLVPTREYVEHAYPFPFFNPVQSQVFPIRNGDWNIIVSANTSSGKTICAEIMMDYIISQGKKIVYTSPLKSLSSEKFAAWEKRFAEHKIVMLTGDTLYSEAARKKQMREAAESQIIIATSELLDSVTRKAGNPMYEWINQIGLLVVDESHCIGDPSRGHAIEVGIMRFAKINPNARIVFLSATMVNADEIAKWVSSLNDKETKVVFSTWRPVELQFNYYEYPTSGYYWPDENAKIALSANVIMSKPNEKWLVFVHSKGAGRSVIKALQEKGEVAQFHNADLDSTDRSDIENSFESRKEGSLRVLVSTPTLAMGRNLPARNVLIVGDKRGIEDVDELSVIQMVGRAGRPGFDDAGFVHMVLPEGRGEHWKYVFANPRPTKSTLSDHRKLGFHILAEIDNKQITNARSAKDWYKRSLASLQNVDFTDEDIEALLSDLEKMNMITRSGPWINITGLGRVSAWLYFPPDDIWSWATNFQQAFTIGASDLLLGWAIGDIPTNNWGYVPKDCKDDVATFEWQLRNRNVRPTMASPFGLAAYRCLTGDEADNTAIQKRAIQFDIYRIVQALSLIDSMWGKWERKELWSTLPARIMYGVSEEVVFLTKLSGIGGKRAIKLWDNGFHSFDDISNPSNRGKLFKLFSPALANKVVKEATVLAASEENKQTA